MTPLDRLRELESKATAGPWEVYASEDQRTKNLAELLAWGRTFGTPNLHDKDGALPTPDATFIAESRNALPNLLTLEALARDEHDQRCGCTGEACKLGEVLRVLDGEA